jgi:hypothetical protein
MVRGMACPKEMIAKGWLPDVASQAISFVVSTYVRRGRTVASDVC